MRRRTGLRRAYRVLCGVGLLLTLLASLTMRAQAGPSVSESTTVLEGILESVDLQGATVETGTAGSAVSQESLGVAEAQVIANAFETLGPAADPVVIHRELYNFTLEDGTVIGLAVFFLNTGWADHVFWVNGVESCYIRPVAGGRVSPGFHPDHVRLYFDGGGDWESQPAPHNRERLWALKRSDGVRTYYVWYHVDRQFRETSIVTKDGTPIVVLKKA